MHSNDVIDMPVCIYHADCLDGTAAAWVVWEYYDANVFLVPLQYPADKQLPSVDIEGRDVFVVDFSFTKEVLAQMCEKAAWVTVLDHHVSAKEALTYQSQEEMPENLTLIFDMEQSGCALTWKQFHGRNMMPPLLAHIQDRDLWRFELSGTKEICAAIGLYDLSMFNMDILINTAMEDLEKTGFVLLQRRDQDISRLLDSSVIWRNIAGYSVPVVNCPVWMASDVGQALMEKFNCAFSATYSDLAEGRKFSLRSANTSADVSKIAKTFGGGGHRNAAGFLMPESFQFPFDIPPQ